MSVNLLFLFNMKSREELKKQHRELLEVHKKIADQLSRYPNVVKVGIGIKEEEGELTGEPCIKIVVEEKKEESDLNPEEIIPGEIEGFKTDVIVRVDKIPLAVCAEDRNNYRPVRGGIMICNYRFGSGKYNTGTMGCLAQRNSDGSWVLLSNYHVIYQRRAQDGDEIGQPWVGCSLCCKSNVIARNVDKDQELDCAIAEINEEIAIENVIEEIGDIKGDATASPVLGEKVRKRGSRTGLTSGTVDFIDPDSKEITIIPNPPGGPADDPGGCTNYLKDKVLFAYEGDSGSVLVNDNNEVIALLYRRSTSGTPVKIFANDIGRIESKLKITIKTTNSAPGVTPVYRREIANKISEDHFVSDETLAEYFESRLENSKTGQEVKKVINRHREEVLHLVRKHRPVALTWQRKQGPAFIAAFNRSIKNPDYTVPEKINKVSFQNLLMSMATALEEHGSESLQQDIGAYAVDLIALSRKCNTADEFIDIISAMDDKTPVAPICQPPAE